jgi:PAS domain S-box-containing protein
MSPSPPSPPPPNINALLDAADGIALVEYDTDLRVVRWGGGAEKMFGYRADWLEGHATADLLHPGGEFESVLARATTLPVRARMVATTRAGESLTLLAVIDRLGPAESPAGWVVLYTDQTSQERAQKELQALRQATRTQMGHHSELEARFLGELLRHTADNIQIGLAVQELETGMITYVNDGFERITGIGKVGSLGQSIDSLFASYPRMRDYLKEYLAHVAANEEGGSHEARHWEVELATGKRTLEVYARLISIEGFDQKFILLIVEDNTERHKLQLQLVQSEKLAAIGQLAAGIAHEIRNPLNTIYNALFDLDEIVEKRTADIAEDIAISMEEIKRVQDIINNLLDFARETDKATGQADLNDVIQKTVRLVQHDLDTRGIQVETDLGDVPEVAMASNALKQILINLITNASQAMSHGGRLRITTSRMAPAQPPAEPEVPAPATDGPPSRRRRRRSSERVLLTVADNGVGMPPHVMANIFNPFFTTKEPGSGTGLGLSVVHSLLRDSGGAIRVDSVEGEGSTFSLELPAVADQR